jgi:hypothetical protein
VLQATNSHPTKFDRIMLLTAFPPAPPIPTTVMRGFISCSSLGMLRLIMRSPPLRRSSMIPGLGRAPPSLAHARPGE